MCRRRMAPMRLAPFSYFRTFWNVSPRASATRKASPASSVSVRPLLGKDAVHMQVDFTSRKRFRKQALLVASRNELYPSIDQPTVQ
jgi:hypothetical protein